MKLIEKLIQRQLRSFLENKLSDHLCGYQKGYTTQYPLLDLIEKWKKVRDERSYSAAVLVDLSKAFDTINHDLLIAKLHAYSVHGKSIKLIRDYLCDRFERTKVNLAHNTWKELLTHIPKGSVLGPLSFNTYLNGVFHMIECTEICNFADDTIPYSSCQNLKEAMTNVVHNCAIFVKWFWDNLMTLNTHKLLPVNMDVL